MSTVCTKDSWRERCILALREYPGTPRGQAYAWGLLFRSLALARAGGAHILCLDTLSNSCKEVLFG